MVKHLLDNKKIFMDTNRVISSFNLWVHKHLKFDKKWWSDILLNLWRLHGRVWQDPCITITWPLTQRILTDPVHPEGQSKFFVSLSAIALCGICTPNRVWLPASHPATSYNVTNTSKTTVDKKMHKIKWPYFDIPQCIY